MNVYFSSKRILTIEFTFPETSGFELFYIFIIHPKPKGSMKKYTLIFLAIFALITCTNAQTADPYLWLEEVDGKKALEFVEQQNKVTLDKLTHEKDYQSIYAKSLEIYNSTDR